jgi:hypothetical protein
VTDQQLPTGVEQGVAAVSLEQALIDVEIANARAIDLTRRILEAHHQMDDLRRRLAEADEAYAALAEEIRLQRSSKAFQTVERIWAVRRRIGV